MPGLQTGDGMVNEDRARALVGLTDDAVAVLDEEGRLLAASAAARERFPELATGQPVQAGDGLLTLYLSEPLTAYEELRAGFTAAVSHELRTPLARIMTLVESVELPGADTAELVEQARQEIAQVRELIDDVLFLGELETGGAVVALGTTVALPVLEEAVGRLRESADRAGVTLDLRAEPGVALPLRPRMLRVIVENLIENSLRYAGPGATCAIELAPGDGASVLSVADDGAGVSDEDLPRLFERFYRSDRARASRGTGLGLAIVKHVVTAAGGSVEATGGPGRGLTIRCIFPLG
jgi:two-component system phosphate regulon sensor histidine kinase PhoR